MVLVALFVCLVGAGCQNLGKPRYEILGANVLVFEPGSQSQALVNPNGVQMAAGMLPAVCDDDENGSVLPDDGDDAVEEVASVVPGPDGPTVKAAAGRQVMVIGGANTLSKDFDTAAALTQMQRLKNSQAGVTPGQGVEGQGEGAGDVEGEVEDSDSASLSVPAVP